MGPQRFTPAAEYLRMSTDDQPPQFPFNGRQLRVTLSYTGSRSSLATPPLAGVAWRYGIDLDCNISFKT